MYPHTLFRTLLPLALAWTLSPAAIRTQEPHEEPQGEVRLPSGKLQRDEILKARHRESLRDIQEIQQLSTELRADLEKNDYHVMSIKALKNAERIEKLARGIRNRMRD